MKKSQTLRKLVAKNSSHANKYAGEYIKKVTNKLRNTIEKSCSIKRKKVK